MSAGSAVIKRSVALAITDPAHPGAVLIVQRPDDDDDLPGIWGLPAASLTAGETWQDAASRAARDKLGIELVPGPALAEGTATRDSYTLQMRLYAAHVSHGTPHVPQTVAGVTQYQSWRWGSAADLTAPATRGSLCSRLYLGSV